MGKTNFKNNKNDQEMGLTTLSNDEMKNVYGGAKIYFVQEVKGGKIVWTMVIK